jgi:malonate decarboxylase gamma subunit
MVLNDVLSSLFPAGHDVVVQDDLLTGSGHLGQAGRVNVIGVCARAPVGVDHALVLAGKVLDIAQQRPCPLLVLIDSDSQRMSKRDELLGLSQFLAHLAACLRYADARGHHTVGLLYGHTAAGAFIATALATRSLVALPGADPAVMDLPSMARVTKLPLAVLEEKARATPVFAPGLDNLARTGAIAAVLDPAASLADQVIQALQDADGADIRDQAGRERGGRPKAGDIATRVYDAALAAA